MRTGTGEAEKKSDVGHQGLIPFKVVVVLTYVSGCKRNWVARWRGKFADFFSTLSLSKRYNHLDERTLLSLLRHEGLLQSYKQGYLVKAGIEAVSTVPLLVRSEQNSQSWFFGIWQQLFSSGAYENSPYQ